MERRERNKQREREREMREERDFFCVPKTIWVWSRDYADFIDCRVE